MRPFYLLAMAVLVAMVPMALGLTTTAAHFEDGNLNPNPNVNAGPGRADPNFNLNLNVNWSSDDKIKIQRLFMNAKDADVKKLSDDNPSARDIVETMSAKVDRVDLDKWKTANLSVAQRKEVIAARVKIEALRRYNQLLKFAAQSSAAQAALTACMDKITPLQTAAAEAVSDGTAVAIMDNADLSTVTATSTMTVEQARAKLASFNDQWKTVVKCLLSNRAEKALDNHEKALEARVKMLQGLPFTKIDTAIETLKKAGANADLVTKIEALEAKLKANRDKLVTEGQKLQTAYAGVNGQTTSLEKAKLIAQENAFERVSGDYLRSLKNLFDLIVRATIAANNPKTEPATVATISAEVLNQSGAIQPVDIAAIENTEADPVVVNSIDAGSTGVTVTNGGASA